MLFVVYLVPHGFAHEEGGDVVRQDVLQEKLVDVLHGLHLLSLRLEASLQQEVHTAAELVLSGETRAREQRKLICLRKRNKGQVRTNTFLWTHLSGQDEAHDVEDDQPHPGHDLRILQNARPEIKHIST